MGFSRQEYWSELPFPFPGDLSDPGIEPRSPASQADFLLTELREKHLIKTAGRNEIMSPLLNFLGKTLKTNNHQQMKEI